MHGNRNVECLSNKHLIVFGVCVRVRLWEVAHVAGTGWIRVYRQTELFVFGRALFVRCAERAHQRISGLNLWNDNKKKERKKKNRNSLSVLCFVFVVGPDDHRWHWHRSSGTQWNHTISRFQRFLPLMTNNMCYVWRRQLPRRMSFNGYASKFICDELCIWMKYIWTVCLGKE